jgi:hypothetical protein
MSIQTERDKVTELLKTQQRSMNWLAKQMGINRQSVHQWLVEGRKPRDPKVFEKMRQIVLGSMGGYELGRPMIPVGFPLGKMRFAGDVPCGSDWGDPLASEEFIEVEAQFEHPQRFAARVVGDSCYPALLPGDITIWHKDMNPTYGLIVLAQRKGDHGCTVKSLEYDEKLGRPRLHAINPSAGAPEDGEGWGVIARCVAVIRNTDGLRRSWYLDTGLRSKHLS